MHHRIYTTPFTRINEHWISDNSINGSPSDPYKDPLIKNKANYYKENNILDLQASWYKHIAIDIVTETVYNYPYPQTTEKILRPLLCKRMFIIVGAQNTLAWLQSKGFKTFSPFINEEYDNIQDPKNRIIAITSEIKRLCNIPIATIQDTILEHSDVLEHNFNLLQNLEKIEFQQIEKDLS
jgi:hypothetical protein